MSVMRRGTVTTLVVGTVISLCAGGCSPSGDGFDLTKLLRPPTAPVEPGFPPASPSAVLRLFEWSYNNREASTLHELFTADFVFSFSPLDSAGALYRVTPWGRADELATTHHLFSGGSDDQPRASIIRLSLDRNFLVFVDPRTVAWDPLGRWHKNIRTQVMLNIQTGDGNAIDISGAANFYLVRGDSAAIPADLVARGFAPDSTRWWINRWEDETAQGGPGLERSPGVRVARASSRLGVQSPQPSSNRTWGGVKALYR